MPVEVGTKQVVRALWVELARRNCAKSPRKSIFLGTLKFPCSDAGFLAKMLVSLHRNNWMPYLCFSDAGFSAKKPASLHRKCKSDSESNHCVIFKRKYDTMVTKITIIDGFWLPLSWLLIYKWHNGRLAYLPTTFEHNNNKRDWRLSVSFCIYYLKSSWANWWRLRRQDCHSRAVSGET